MSRICFMFFCFASMLAATAPPAPTPKKSESFAPFTGKIAANKVRLRVKPDLDSHILRQIPKGELLLVVGEEGDFFAVEPPKDTKAYVFRSYIIDDKIEANRVNVRLEPHADAPIVAQLQAGEKVQGQICSLNHKWLEIQTPKTTRFYVSKEYVVKAGGPEFLATMEMRKAQVEEILNAAFLAAEAECKKSFEEMNPQPVIEKFQTVLHTYSDFPDSIATAKEALALLKETYLNKKIAYLESKAELSPNAKTELLAKHRAESLEFFADAPVISDQNLWSKRTSKKGKGNPGVWETIEESLYLSWTAFHSGKKLDDFYSEQKANASILSGYVEPYADGVKDRPGDYLLQKKDGQVAYLYSTHVDLSEHVGKTVTLIASPRPNNHFAFPAYYVLSVE